MKKHLKQSLTAIFRLSPVVLALGFVPGAFAVDGITDLGILSGKTSSAAFAVNDAGTMIVGLSYTDKADHNTYSATTWTPTGLIQSLYTLPAGAYSIAYDVNAVGDVIVGYGNTGANTNTTAFRWTAATGAVSLGTLNGGFYSEATGVSNDGNVVVGEAWDGIANGQRAFIWNSSTQIMQALPLPNQAVYSSGANAVSGDGFVVVGDVHMLVNGVQGQRSFRWTSSSGMVDLGALNGGLGSSAYDVNLDGSVIVGEAGDGAANGSNRAYRWTAAAGMVSLGVLPGAISSEALGVNALGDVVVGDAVFDLAGTQRRAFRWTAATQMQTVEDWLISKGVVVNPNAPKTKYATATNAEGNVVVGDLDNGHAFIARVSSSNGGGGGMIDTTNFNQSLQGSAGVPMIAIQNADMVMNGAHSSPMRGLLAEGSQSYWVGGDWGRSDYRDANADIGSGEVGYARGLDQGLMLKLALGRTYSKQNTLFGGNATIDGTYLMPELIYTIPNTKIYATLSGYYNTGDADIKRGYLNAGTPVLSSGKANTNTAAVRVRFDWLNALALGKAAFTPYASLSYSRTSLDGYTETGGGFPAVWESRKEDSTQVRLGGDAVYTLNEQVNLLGRLEAVHRFESHGVDAKVNAGIGGSFDFAGAAYKQDWLRTAVGAEAKLFKGTGSLMLNGTTEASTPNYWIAANYRYDF